MPTIRELRKSNQSKEKYELVKSIRNKYFAQFRSYNNSRWGLVLQNRTFINCQLKERTFVLLGYTYIETSLIQRVNIILIT